MSETLTTIEPQWIEEEVALRFHSEQVAEHGGADGIRDKGLFQSAMARPMNAFHYNKVTSLAKLAAAYAFGIAKNQAFVDGNKRTALVVSLAFLEVNGCALSATQEENYYTYLALAEGKLTEEALADWMESKIYRFP